MCECRFLDQAAVVDRESPAAASSWTLCTRTDVEEVKQVVRMLPTWATTIIFWTVYAQMTTFSVSQAQALDRRLGPSFVIPAGSLTVFFVGSILLTVPIYDRLIAPLARRLTGNPQGLSPLQRIFVGLFLSILAMVVAGLTERHRLSASTAGVQLSVFLIVPQFLLVGAGEAFTYIGQLDFFLCECPRDMKTMSTGLFLTTLCLGFFLSSALVSLVRGATTWLGDTINHSRLDYFYWLLAVLGAINLAAYLLCAMWATPAASSKAEQPHHGTAADEKC